jgi:hypothetical protein
MKIMINFLFADKIKMMDNIINNLVAKKEQIIRANKSINLLKIIKMGKYQNKFIKLIKSKQINI